jgi:hypothetical protein
MWMRHDYHAFKFDAVYSKPSIRGAPGIEVFLISAEVRHLGEC